MRLIKILIICMLIATFGYSVEIINNYTTNSTPKPNDAVSFYVQYNTSDNGSYYSFSWNASGNVEIEIGNPNCQFYFDNSTNQSWNICNFTHQKYIPSDAFGKQITRTIQINDMTANKTLAGNMAIQDFSVYLLAGNSSIRMAYANTTANWTDGSPLIGEVYYFFEGGETWEDSFSGSSYEDYKYHDFIMTTDYTVRVEVIKNNVMRSSEGEVEINGKSLGNLETDVNIITVQKSENKTIEAIFTKSSFNTPRNVNLSVSFENANITEVCDSLPCTKIFTIPLIAEESWQKDMVIIANWTNDDGTNSYIEREVVVEAEVIIDLSLEPLFYTINVTDVNNTLNLRVENLGSIPLKDLRFGIVTCPGGWDCEIDTKKFDLEPEEERDFELTINVEYPETVIERRVKVRLENPAIEEELYSEIDFEIGVELVEYIGQDFIYYNIIDPDEDVYYFISGDEIVRKKEIDFEDITPRVRRTSPLSVWTVQLDTEKSKGMGEVCDISVVVEDTVYKIDKEGIVLSLPGEVGAEAYEFLRIKSWGECIPVLKYGNLKTSSYIVSSPITEKIIIDPTNESLMRIEKAGIELGEKVQENTYGVLLIASGMVFGISLIFFVPKISSNIKGRKLPTSLTDTITEAKYEDHLEEIKDERRKAERESVRFKKRYDNLRS